MAPTVEKTERLYFIKLRSRPEPIRIRAAVICEPSETNKHYTLKREGQPVASFDADDVSGWWIEEDPPAREWKSPGSLA